MHAGIFIGGVVFDEQLRCGQLDSRTSAAPASVIITWAHASLGAAPTSSANTATSNTATRLHRLPHSDRFPAVHGPTSFSELCPSFHGCRLRHSRRTVILFLVPLSVCGVPGWRPSTRCWTRIRGRQPHYPALVKRRTLSSTTRYVAVVPTRPAPTRAPPSPWARSPRSSGSRGCNG